MKVAVQNHDFDASAEIAALRASRSDVGAVAAFIGTVRDLHDEPLQTLTLEHYPGMTETALREIAQESIGRFGILDACIIHRVGPLAVSDQIVLVVAISAHRHAAFQACEYMMDYLKTRAPFWKKEQTIAGGRWVDARTSDDELTRRWEGD